MHHWHIYSDNEIVSNKLSDFLADTIQQVLTQRANCTIALPGGQTPAACLKRLSQKNLPWEKIHWYLGDERCLPVGDPERNDTMLQKNLWSLIAAPENHIHKIQAELGAQKAANLYSNELNNIQPLDIAFLGMGEDGHTASLFPDNPALQQSEHAVPVYDSPKPPAERVSMSQSFLQAASTRIVLAMGDSKKNAIRAVQENQALPVNRIGDIHWFIDKLASV